MCHWITKSSWTSANKQRKIACYGTDDKVDYDIIDKINEILTNIPQRERDIIKHCYGIGVKEMNLNEIGDVFKISRERVRQIREAGILRMKMHINNEKV